ncbi:hypothetical protein PG991_000958 [Apiospora marii]|uniref:Uncharacterized protein n=1 Tax=Apiospora marii TaxID=335849 RepID=A0ABR1STR9_9PEZI
MGSGSLTCPPWPSPGARAPAADLDDLAAEAELPPLLLLLLPPMVMFLLLPLMSMPGMLGSMSPSPSFMPPWAETAAAAKTVARNLYSCMVLVVDGFGCLWWFWKTEGK